MGRALLRHMAENQQEEESVDHTQVTQFILTYTKALTEIFRMHCIA